MKWITVFVLSLVPCCGFTLNYGDDRKSNDLSSVKSLKIRDKIKSNEVVNNNEADNKFKTAEDEGHESDDEDSDGFYFSDEDEDSDGYEKDDDTDDNAVPEYLYYYVDDNGIADENHNGNKHETELETVTTKYGFEPSVGKTTPKNYEDSSNKRKDASEHRIINYVYGKFNNRGNDENDLNNDIQYVDGSDNNERTAEEEWPSLADDSGVRAVAGYVVEPGRERYGNPRCLIGMCAPPRNKCEPGLVRNKAGDCVVQVGTTGARR
jgi:hypothetical protein